LLLASARALRAAFGGLFAYGHLRFATVRSARIRSQLHRAPPFL